MSEIKLPEYLESVVYPGRGIIIGQSADSNSIIIAYFIMGRSENSRNRVFEKTADGIKTKAYDESKLKDPSLVIYTPIRKYKNNIIVTNGDQTDTVYDFLSVGKSFGDALRTRTFEPDPPILTPRISGIITISDSGAFNYRLSILKSDGGSEKHTLRYFYEYETPEIGKGHFIHTYKHNADVPPPFEGEPKKVDISVSIDEFFESIWDSLSSDFKVSLYVAYINITTGEIREKIINKNI
ncbi:MAG: IMP cyclohydrolase [Oscillospiraceae bacterium]|nr:IMP cyclohydrolase [Oscillospiraceae bacterium]